MIIDILQIIANNCKLCDQLKCIVIDKFTCKNILIFSLNVHPNIDCNILKQRKFNKLKKIECTNASKIKNINNLAFLNETLEEIVYSEIFNGKIDRSLFHNLKKLKNISVCFLYANSLNFLKYAQCTNILRYS